MTRTVMIDPGHGGDDPGAVGPAGSLEKDLNLQVASLVRQELQARGIEVLMTRESDVRLGVSSEADLVARSTVANRIGPDLFLSIHHNAAGIQASGCEVWCRRSNPRDEEMGLAAMLSESVATAFGIVNRGAKCEDFAVLRWSEPPAVLIELGFLSNPQEEKLLGDAQKQAAAAQAIAASIAAWLESEEEAVAERHWAQGALDDFIAKGLIDTAEAWQNLDQPVSKGLLLSLLAKIWAAQNR